MVKRGGKGEIGLKTLRFSEKGRLRESKYTPYGYESAHQPWKKRGYQQEKKT